MRHRIVGSIKAPLSISKLDFTTIDADIVDVDVPFLLEQDVLTNLKVLLNVEIEKISLHQLEQEFPRIQKRENLYSEEPPKILFIIPELRKIHRHFSTPTRKIFFRCCAVQSHDPLAAVSFLLWKGFDANAMFVSVLRTLLFASASHYQHLLRTASSMKVSAST